MGPGLFESVYEEILFYELTESGLNVKRQSIIPVIWKGRKLEKAFQADLIVNDKVLIELKSVQGLADVHYKQVLTYIRLLDIKLDLLINFNERLIKDGIHRVVNNL